MAQAQARRDVPQRVHAAAARRSSSSGMTSPTRSRRTSTPRALAVMHEWGVEGQHENLVEALEIFGLKSLSSRSPRPTTSSRSPTRGSRHASGRTSRRPTGCEPRSRPPAGRCATASAGTCSDANLDVRPRYGRRAVREALRGRREVLEVWATDRAAQGRAVARRRARACPAGARADRGRRHTRPPGSGRARRAVPLRRRARAGRGGKAAARGARPRHRPAQPRRRLPLAEGAGATGVVVPAHGSAVVTPAVARSSAGAVEHLPVAVVTNLARYLGDVKGPTCGCTALPVRAARRCGTPTWAAASRSCSAPRARGCGRSCADVRRAVSIPLLGSVESLNVSVAAAVLLYEARRQRAHA